ERYDDVVLGAGLGGIVGRRDAPHRGFAAHLERQALVADRGEVGAARDERDLGTGVGQQGAQVAADGARAVDRDLHPPRPSFWASPMRCSLPVAPLGISSMKRIVRGTLKSARRWAAKARRAASSALWPSFSTTTAATSSPSLGCGTAKVTTWATAGWSIS